MKRAVLLLVLLATAAQGSELTDGQRAQMEQLRGEVANQVQLQAYDLLDELVFGWTQEPFFEKETPVVLADVTAPVGFGSGLKALLENHVAGLLLRNPKSRVVLAHCPQCSALVVHSGAKATVISRGVDSPEALAKMGALSSSRHALFLDFEMEGSALVLRARVTSLEPSLPIIHAKTLTTSTSSPALLRSELQLKSAKEAHDEYVGALTGRSLFLVPVRLGFRSYAPSSLSPVAIPPFIWLQVGIEASLSQARAWTAGLSLGASWSPELHTAWMGQVRFGRLLSGSEVSLSHPDLYGFAGLSIMSVHGNSALLFQRDIPNLEDAIALAFGKKPHALVGGVQLGLELRIKNRIGASVWTETLLGMNGVVALGNYLDLGIIQFHSLGAEVSFCF